MTSGYAASLCIGLIFLAAGLTKLRHRQLLPGVIANYRLLPEEWVNMIARVLPGAEIALGAMLIAGEHRVAPVAAVALLLLFAYAIAVNIRRGRHAIDCGCGRPQLKQVLSWALVSRNVLLSLMLVPAIGAVALPTGIDFTVAIAAGLTLYLAYNLFQAIGALERSAMLLNASRQG